MLGVGLSAHGSRARGYWRLEGPPRAGAVERELPPPVAALVIDGSSWITGYSYRDREPQSAQGRSWDGLWAGDGCGVLSAVRSPPISYLGFWPGLSPPSCSACGPSSTAQTPTRSCRSSCWCSLDLSLRHWRFLCVCSLTNSKHTNSPPLPSHSFSSLLSLHFAGGVPAPDQWCKVACPVLLEFAHSSSDFVPP